MRIRDGGPVMLATALLAIGLTAIAASAVPVNTHVPPGPRFSVYPNDTEPSMAFHGQTGVVLWIEDPDEPSLKWGTTLDGGQTWVFSGFRYVGGIPLERGRLSLCVDANGHFYSIRQVDFGDVVLSRGEFVGGVFSWGPSTPVLTVDRSNPRPQNVKLACDPDGTLYFAYRWPQLLGAPHYPYSVRFMRSTDGGASWSSPVQLSSDSSGYSRVAAGPDGSVVVSWVDFGRQQVMCARSTDHGASFAPPVPAAPYRDNLNALPPGETSGFTTSPWYARAYGFINIPTLAVDTSPGPYRGRIYLAWSEMADGVPGPRGTLRGEIEPNNTPDQATLVNLGDDFGGFIPTSDSGPTDPDWWAFDGLAGQSIYLTTQTQYSPPPSFIPEGLQLYFCAVPGQPPVRISTSAGTDGAVASPATVLTLPGTGRYFMMQSGAGPYSVSYSVQLRDYPISPTSVSRDLRDIVLTWSDDGGQTWAPRQRISDAPARFNDCLPELAVDERGFVHVAWYDFRDEPACGSRAGVYWRISANGGRSFLPAQRIAEYASTWDMPGTLPAVGEHLGLTTQGPYVHFAWADSRDAINDIPGARTGMEIYHARVLVDATTATEASVAAFEAAPAAGGVRLEWTVDGVEHVTRFRLLRAQVGAEFVPLAMAMPTPTRESHYEVRDADVGPGQRYRYRLELVLRSGEIRTSPVAEALVPGDAARLALGAPQPNPSTGDVRVRLSAPTREAVRVTVHDLRGAEVATLHEGALEPGETLLHWDGRATRGALTAPGMYLLRATSATGQVVTQRIARVR